MELASSEEELVGNSIVFLAGLSIDCAAKKLMAKPCFENFSQF